MSGIKYNLYKQKPKVSKNPISGYLSVGDLPPNGKIALLSEREAILDELVRPEIVFINPHGIKLRGFERAGVDRQHNEKFIYQEWWCVYIDEILKEKGGK